MAQVRFLDQVAVTAFASNADATNVGRLPRVIQAGETLTAQANQQLVGFDFYILEGGLVTIEAGEQVNGISPPLYTHGLIQIESTFTNEGTLVNNGYLVLGTELQ